MPKPITSIEIWSGDEQIAQIDKQEDGRFVVEAAATKQTTRGALVAVVAAMEMLGGTQ